jgi:protocatechuate 3,4-dioxygenase beta subunit
MTTGIPVALLLLNLGLAQSAPPASPGAEPPVKAKKAPKAPPINPAETGGARGLGLLLRGIVVDSTERAVAGARIRLSADQRGELPRETSADAEGRFQLPVERAGTYTLEISRPGFRTLKQPGLKIDSLLCSVRSTMRAGNADEVLTVSFVELRGQVRNAAGDAVPEAQLEFTAIGSTRPVVVATDADGEFRAANLQTGPYALRITAAGYAAYEDKNLQVQASYPPHPPSLTFELHKRK